MCPAEMETTPDGLGGGLGGVKEGQHVKLEFRFCHFNGKTSPVRWPGHIKQRNKGTDDGDFSCLRSSFYVVQFVIKL